VPPGCFIMRVLGLCKCAAGPEIAHMAHSDRFPDRHL
jgi:hypothetical protein